MTSGSGLNNEGLVEVFHGGRWGVICDNDWGDSDASVVCRMLGYNGPSEATRQRYTTEEFLLDEVDCDGDEAQIHACSHSGWGSHNCHANEGAGVICSNVGGKALVEQALDVVSDVIKAKDSHCTFACKYEWVHVHI